MSNTVFLEYNPYEPCLKAFINDCNISKYSHISAFEHRPFTDWGSRIFSELSREVNEEYVLRFSGCDALADILEKSAEDDGFCRGFERVFPPVNTSLEDRLEALSCLGADAEKRVTVYLFGEESVQDAAFEILEESGMFDEDDGELVCTSLPCFLLAVKRAADFEEIPKDRSAMAVYITISDETEEFYRAARYYDAPVFVFRTGGATEFSHTERNFYFYDVDADDIADTLVRIALDLPVSLAVGAEYRRLNAEFESGELLLTDAEAQSLQLVSRIKPCYKIDAAARMYLGRRTELAVIETPFVRDAAYTFSSSAPMIIEIDGTAAVAKAPGAAKLSVYKDGSPELLCEAEVFVESATLINALAIFPQIKRVRRGTEEKIELKFYPEDAVNADEIRWKTDDESVATVDEGGFLTANREGTTYLTVYTPDVEDKMKIIVE